MPPLDVAIVGAGPAGAWAARKLALAGARVAVFDASHPREKPCGGGLTARALRFVHEAGVSERVRGVPIVAARFTSQGAMDAAVVGLTAANAPQLLVVARKELDAALLQSAVAAGAEWRRERVHDVVVGRTKASVKTAAGCIDAGFVVGADGANSLVRRRLSIPFSRAQLSIATGFFARGVTSTHVAVHCVADPPGYIWSFPRAEHTAIGICAQADATGTARLRDVVHGWIRAESDAARAPLDFYSWPIPSLGQADFARERPSGERWAIAGDAAGLVDPLTREGIYFALRSADLLGDALGGDSAWARYADALRDEIHPELARAAALKARFFTSDFTDLLVEALRRSDKVRDVMRDLVAGEQPYATLKRRLLRTFEVGLAWRLLMMQLEGMVS